MKKLGTFLHKIYHLVTKPEMQTLPGQVAFFFVLSIIPLIALVGGIASLFSVSTSGVVELIQNTLPHGVAELLTPLTVGQTPSYGMIIFFLSAFFLASNGTNSMITVANTLYKEEQRGVVRQRSKAILMTFLLIGLFTFILLIPIIGETVMNFLRSSNGGNKLVPIVYNTYQLLKLPISIILIYFNMKLLYQWAPDREIDHKSTTAGAIFTTVAWIGITQIYSFYVDKISHYDAFYGSLSNLLILLLWVYFLAYAFVIGMALNASSLKEETEMIDS